MMYRDEERARADSFDSVSSYNSMYSASSSRSSSVSSTMSPVSPARHDAAPSFGGALSPVSMSADAVAATSPPLHFVPSPTLVPTAAPLQHYPTICEPPQLQLPVHSQPLAQQHHHAPPPTHQQRAVAPQQQPVKHKKKYICSSCQKGFTTSGHLARHTRIHTGEKNYECPHPDCSMRFARQDNCMQHYRIHMGGRSRGSAAGTAAAAVAAAAAAAAGMSGAAALGKPRKSSVSGRQ